MTFKIWKKTSFKTKNYLQSFSDKIPGSKLKDKSKSNLTSIMMIPSKNTTSYLWMLIN